MRQWIGSIGLFLLVTSPAAAQDFDFPATAVEDSITLSSAMPKLAGEVIDVYREDDRRIYLDNPFRLQMVAGQYAGTSATKPSPMPSLAVMADLDLM